jgi:hypothetical protein
MDNEKLSIVNYQLLIVVYRGLSSAGRAPALQAGGQRFDPVSLHQQKPVSGESLVESGE